MPPLKVAIAGLGTIGALLVERLTRQAEFIAHAAARQVELVAVSARKPRDYGSAVINNPLDLAQRQNVGVVIELMGGADGIAHDLVKAALAHGKHVITANKSLLAEHGMELAQLAEQQGLCLNYEAAIASGIPIVKSLRESLIGIEINQIHTILNGTSNYILCQMADEKISFQEALATAQQQGYAEADPHLDISGEDAAHKLKLLMSLAFGCRLSDIPTQGIQDIHSLDIGLAHQMGYAIKLIAHAQKNGEYISGAVRPMLVPLESRLAQSRGTHNVIALYSHHNHLCLEGEGAGAYPASNGVLADIVDIARGMRLPVFGVPVQQLAPRLVKEQAQPSAFYLRVLVMDRAGSMAGIAQLMAACDISLASVSQPPLDKKEQSAPIAMMTHPVLEDKIEQALAKLAASQVVIAPPLAIKIADG